MLLVGEGSNRVRSDGAAAGNHSAPAQPTKSVARGAAVGGVGGAALGAGIGAIAGGSSGAGRGAGIGALAGGTFGGVRSHSQNQQAEQAQRQREQESKTRS